MTTKNLDKKFMGRPNPAQDLEIVKSKGSILYDQNGKGYIDFFMGWCAGNIGWGNTEIRKAVSKSTYPEYVYPGYYYKRWAELAELLASIMPGNLTRSYRTTGGTESVDAAMQIAMCYTGRKKFISVEGGYHGNSIATLSLSNKQFLPNCEKIDAPINAKAAKKLEPLLKRKDVAAFIMEPIICNIGVHIPDQEFMDTLQDMCKKYGTLLVMDEVATGFGRTGKFFATEHYGLKPDIMTIAKGFSGGYGALGSVITTDKIAKSVEGKISLYSTFGWHPVSVEAAIANINFMLKNKNKIFQNIEVMSEYFRQRLGNMPFKKVNVKGLAIGVEIDKGGEKLQEKCLKKGLLINTEESLIFIFPALNIDKKVAKAGLDILESCL